VNQWKQKILMQFYNHQHHRRQRYPNHLHLHQQLRDIQQKKVQPKQQGLRYYLPRLLGLCLERLWQ
jgi:hypothetical protein